MVLAALQLRYIELVLSLLPAVKLRFLSKRGSWTRGALIPLSWQSPHSQGSPGHTIRGGGKAVAGGEQALWHITPQPPHCSTGTPSPVKQTKQLDVDQNKRQKCRPHLTLM